MSDATKFINTYVDIAVALTHENLNTILQLKTQLKLANDLALDKDQIVSGLESEIERLKNENNRIGSLENNAINWENQFNAMKNKVSHMETLSTQYNELKSKYVLQEKELERLKNSKKKQPIPKNDINKEETKSSTISKLTVKEEPIETDDF